MTCAIAFNGTERLAAGPPADVALAVKRLLAADPAAAVLVFDAASSRPVEFDLRGADEEVVARLAAPPPPPKDAARGRGRPKLGVTSREVTLLPRQWEWLADQRGGASATLRRLVDEARKMANPADGVRAARESLYRFMTAMAGDAPGYEEATRALFAGDAARFAQQIQAWPADVRAHALALSQAAF